MAARRQNRPSSMYRIGTDTRVVTVAYVKTGRWWHVEVAGGDALCTQGRTLSEASANIRDVIDLMKGDAWHQFPFGVVPPRPDASYAEYVQVTR